MRAEWVRIQSHQGAGTPVAAVVVVAVVAAVAAYMARTYGDTERCKSYLGSPVPWETIDTEARRTRSQDLRGLVQTVAVA
jgi:hypothetical protein